MLQLNENYLNLNQNYLFSEVAKRVAAYTEANPDKPVIRLGIGDVTKPLTKKTIDALNEGVSHMANAETFKGYGPEQGYIYMLLVTAGLLILLVPYIMHYYFLENSVQKMYDQFDKIYEHVKAEQNHQA